MPPAYILCRKPVVAARTEDLSIILATMGFPAKFDTARNEEISVFENGKVKKRTLIT